MVWNGAPAHARGRANSHQGRTRGAPGEEFDYGARTDEEEAKINLDGDLAPEEVFK